MIHYFNHSIEGIEWPQQFTYPFHYTPHPLSIIAAEEVKEKIATLTEWSEELAHGKMFGVLIVKNQDNTIGYLAAFSGHIKGESEQDYFVPPIFETLNPNNFFKQEEKNITAINKKIDLLKGDNIYLELKGRYQEEFEKSNGEITSLKQKIKSAKTERKKIRQSTNDTVILQRLINESQFMNAELKRLKEKVESNLASIKAEINRHEKHIDQLKEERKQRSALLQDRIFRQFKLLNALGEEKDLMDIFKETIAKVPPSGSGECAAPKLLQYAYTHHLHPLALAEFWWGASPKKEIRKHGIFYPSCTGKCGPILKHMLQGLDVEANPLQGSVNLLATPEIVYEDEFIVVVNKPAGMLSVPGKTTSFSLLEWLRQRYPMSTGPLLVHRLDMATSGLLLGAKDKETHKKLQQLFKDKRIKKEYVALVDGVIEKESGEVNLPLMPDLMNRPKQLVDYQEGKPSTTTYRVIKRFPTSTLIRFSPITGRTHQIRVHTAHHDGLNAPIIGDTLYGKSGHRLHLHAERIVFEHPITREKLDLIKEIEF